MKKGKHSKNCGIGECDEVGGGEVEDGQQVSP